MLAARLSENRDRRVVLLEAGPVYRVADIPEALLDPARLDLQGAVTGLDALRVVDGPIIPRVPSTVTNLTTIMLAERICRLVYQG